MFKPRQLLLIPALVTFLATAALAERFAIRPGGNDSMVRFDSKAPVESFHGTTDRLEGHVEIDPSLIGDRIDIRIEVDLASLDTGISLRNRHMRENHLETDRFPTALFEGARVINGGGGALTTIVTSFEVEGTFTLHGVTRTIRVPVEVTLLTGPGHQGLRMTGGFKVDLSDYEIARPKFLFLKLGEEQTISFDIFAAAAD